MGWGERSCLRPCRCPEACTMSNCNVRCSKYIWDGITPPDSTISSDVLPVIAFGMKRKGNEKHQSGLNRSERRQAKKSKTIKNGNDGEPLF